MSAGRDGGEAGGEGSALGEILLLRGRRRRGGWGLGMGVQMAEDTVRSTHFFFSTLTRYARDKELPEYAALETLRAL